MASEQLELVEESGAPWAWWAGRALRDLDDDEVRRLAEERPEVLRYLFVRRARVFPVSAKRPKWWDEPADPRQSPTPVRDAILASAKPAPPPTEAGAAAQAIDWDDQPLGQMRDSTLAQRLGVPVLVVRDARWMRDIPPWRERPGRKRFELPPGTPLGTCSDSVIASVHGLTVRQVAKLRERDGIPTPCPPTARPAIEMIPHWVGNVEIAHLFGMTPGQIVGIAQTHGITKRLRGWETKRAKAKRKKRAALARGCRWPKANRDHVDWDSVGLGERSDSEISFETGKSPTTVERHRKARGIESGGPVTRTWVYAFLSEATGLVKIGYSAHPVRRARALSTQSGTHLSVLGVCEGGKPEEAELHTRFGAARQLGEWFERTQEIDEWIATLDRSLLERP